MEGISLRRLALATLAMAMLTASAWVALDDWSAVAQTAARCKGVQATIVGTGASEEIDGTAGRDVIFGRGGSDDIEGKGGRDLVCGGRGNDELDGGGGNDRLYGGTGFDEADGDAGNDVCTAERKESC